MRSPVPTPLLGPGAASHVDQKANTLPSLDACGIIWPTRRPRKGWSRGFRRYSVRRSIVWYRQDFHINYRHSNRIRSPFRFPETNLQTVVSKCCSVLEPAGLSIKKPCRTHKINQMQHTSFRSHGMLASHFDCSFAPAVFRQDNGTNKGSQLFK